MDGGFLIDYLPRCTYAASTYVRIHTRVVRRYRLNGHTDHRRPTNCARFNVGYDGAFRNPAKRTAMWCGVRGRREELDKTYRSPTLHPSPRSYTLNKYFRRHADLRVRRNLHAIYAVLLPSCFETYYRALRCVFMTFITRGEMSTFVPRKTVVGTPSARPPPPHPRPAS